MRRDHRRKHNPTVNPQDLEPNWTHRIDDFEEMNLNPDLVHGIFSYGFKHPSDIQSLAIEPILQKRHVLAQAQSGSGKTGAFGIGILNNVDVNQMTTQALILSPTRELAYQIGQEFQRFTRYMPEVKTVVLYGGIAKEKNIQSIKDEKPCIVIATPGRLKDIIRDKLPCFDVRKVRFFIVDEADKVFEKEDMKNDVQYIFKQLPQDKQVMLFSATMPDKMKEICRSFTHNPIEVFVDDDKKLTLHGLQQYYVKLTENEKTRKLVEILENFKFNQVVIFVSKKSRARALDEILNQVNYSSIAIHSKMEQMDRIKALRQFKNFQKRILVSTDLFARGIDVERVNIVINYDMPNSTDTYLHRVGRAGRFGTKGLAISFVSSSEDSTMLDDIQKRFVVEIPELPETVDASSYMNA